MNVWHYDTRKYINRNVYLTDDGCEHYNTIHSRIRTADVGKRLITFEKCLIYIMGIIFERKAFYELFE